MCVTSGEADISRTRAYTYATETPENVPVHVTAYQNQATNLMPGTDGANCLFLNFAGTGLQLVKEAARPTTMMDDVTRGLLPVEEIRMTRGGSYGAKRVTVQTYGDYTVLTSQSAASILEALDQIDNPRHQVAVTPELRQLVQFYETSPACEGHEFVLGAFDGDVNPRHPIAVQYSPLNPDVLTIPGLDGHDGRPPKVDEVMRRGFKVAFGVMGARLNHVSYADFLIKPWWVPPSVIGFHDNGLRENRDYVLARELVESGLGLDGAELAAELI